MKNNNKNGNEAKHSNQVTNDGNVNVVKGNTPPSLNNIRKIELKQGYIYQCEFFTAVDFMDWYSYEFVDNSNNSLCLEQEISDRIKDIYIQDGCTLIIDYFLVKKDGSLLRVGEIALHPATDLQPAKIYIRPDFEPSFLEYDRNHPDGNFYRDI